MDILKTLEQEFKLKPFQVENTVSLIDEGNTIPFIARYRKEMTGSLDDETLRNLSERLVYLRNLEEKRESVRKADAAVKSMHDFTSPEVLYQELIKSVKKYHPSTDISMIEKAYKVASEAHKDQKRKSGEPYIIHPLCVAIILADLELDKETIVAGLLHDAVEDTWMTYEEVEKEFGSEVALLVDGVTKLGQLSYSKDKVEVQAENLRKMFLAMAKDIRVILIKLADRLLQYAYAQIHDT